MVVYRELASVEKDLGVGIKRLYALSNNIKAHYHVVDIPKKDGSFRKLSIPDEELKYVQRLIAEKILILFPVSEYATAYKYSSRTIYNALPHVRKKYILKLDIRDFFGSILYSQIKDFVFVPEVFSEPIRILLSILCYFKDSLPQGAPTSPPITNILMYEFDTTVGNWCGKRGISYTRYCDDMTFSGDFECETVINFVSCELKKYGFFLNNRKTKFISSEKCQIVTGIVVNEKINSPLKYRKKLRQELYFCRKFGVGKHLENLGSAESPSLYLQRLLGRVNYVLSVSPDNIEMQKYRVWLLDRIRNL